MLYIRAVSLLKLYRYIIDRTMLVLLLLLTACDGLLLNGDGGVHSDTSVEHQINSMMAEIIQLQRDVVDLNKEIGKKSIFQTPKRTVILMFPGITVFCFDMEHNTHVTTQ